MRLPSGLLLVAIVLGACGSKQSSLERSLSACWPKDADTYDAATATGCSPRSVFEICGVPPGSIVNGDGTVTTPDGGIVQCDDACSSSEYSLECTGPSPDAISSPDRSLGCSIIRVPTPSAWLFYCCPCAR